MKFNHCIWPTLKEETFYATPCIKNIEALIYAPNILLMRIVGCACYYCYFLLFAIPFSFSQIDTEFWFVAPEVTLGHGDMPILFRITTLESAANVTISQPANPGFTKISFDIPASSNQTVDLTSNIHNIENRPSLTRLNRGLLIQSDEPITVYYEVNNEVNPDIFSLKGRNALGKEFLIPAQNFWSNSDFYDPKPLSGFDIVASENDTRITITLSKPVMGHPAGSSFDIFLNQGETYSVVTQDRHVTSQLTGTYVKADRFIAITLKDDSNSHNFCHDLGGDQLVPIDVLGTEYIVVKGFLSPNDKVFVMAVNDQTSVTFDGKNGKTLSLNRGEMESFDLVDHAVYIKSTQPLYVLHATGFGCEIGLALVPKLECTGSRSVSFTRSTDEFFGGLIITNTSYTNDFLLNGSSEVISGDHFDTVPGTGGRYSAARIDLTAQSFARTAFRLENTTGSFHFGIINGDNFTGCRYGYFSDFKTLKVNAASTKICKGDSILLNATGSDRFFWIGDPLVEGSQVPEVMVMPDSTTVYSVIGSDASMGCLDTAQLAVEVFQWPIPSVEISRSCIYQPTAFRYHGEEELSHIDWIFEGRDTFQTGWLDTLLVKFEEPGTKHLLVRAANPAGCLTEAEFQFTTGGFDLALDSTIIVTRGETFLLEPVMIKGNPELAVINWIPGVGLSCPTCLKTPATPAVESQYILQLSDSLGCTSVFQTQVFLNEPVFIPNAFSPNGDGINDTFRLYAKGVELESLLIYDRWGKLLYRSQTGMEWDGFILDQIAPPGTYIYYFSGKHTRSQTSFEYSGDVTLLQ